MTRHIASRSVSAITAPGRITARPAAAESHAKDGADMKSMPQHHGSLEGHAH